jgi:hypothetical protein
LELKVWFWIRLLKTNSVPVPVLEIRHCWFRDNWSRTGCPFSGLVPVPEPRQVLGLVLVLVLVLVQNPKIRPGSIIY